jgi:hypothetical protein
MLGYKFGSSIITLSLSCFFVQSRLAVSNHSVFVFEVCAEAYSSSSSCPYRLNGLGCLVDLLRMMMGKNE